VVLLVVLLTLRQWQDTRQCWRCCSGTDCGACTTTTTSITNNQPPHTSKGKDTHTSHGA